MCMTIGWSPVCHVRHVLCSRVLMHVHFTNSNVEEIALISEAPGHTNMVFGTTKLVLFVEVIVVLISNFPQ